MMAYKQMIVALALVAMAAGVTLACFDSENEVECKECCKEKLGAGFEFITGEDKYCECEETDEDRKLKALAEEFLANGGEDLLENEENWEKLEPLRKMAEKMNLIDDGEDEPLDA